MRDMFIVVCSSENGRTGFQPECTVKEPLSEVGSKTLSPAALPPDVRKVCDLPENDLDYFGAVPPTAGGTAPSRLSAKRGRSQTFRTSGGKAAREIGKCKALCLI